MRDKTIEDDYYNWLCKSIFANSGRRKVNYSRVIKHLYDTEFIWSMAMDANRADDGIGLRYRYAQAAGYNNTIIQYELDNKPCSILEMMVALSLRCEEDIMGDPNNILLERWFWVMMDNSGLSQMTNERYNPNVTQDIIDRLLLRQYGPHGEGGYFPVNNSGDARILDIWWTLNMYLTEHVRRN